MRPHHTKTKGDLGVLHAQLDLARRGYGILIPLTEHESFDLVAYKAGRFLRIQVKYRAAVDGAVRFGLVSSWADRHGTHEVPIDRNSIDLICLYCPDTDRCYYLDPQRFGRGVCLRLQPTKNRQKKGIVWAADFTEVPDISHERDGTSQDIVERRGYVRHCREPRAPWFSSAHSSVG